METLVKVTNLTKRFGNITAVENISFEIKEGSCISLLGSNGAGKTTTLRMLSGISKPTDGNISFKGMKGDIRNIIGFLPQYPKFPAWMTGLEFLVYSGKLADLSRKESKERAGELVELVGMLDAKDRKIGKYSGGMKQRLGIAQALIHRPRLLMLDEPVSALDPIGRRDILEMLHRLKKETTILFSTHILNDAEEVSDDVVIINNGKVAMKGELHELQRKYQQSVILLRGDDFLYDRVENWKTSGMIEDYKIENGSIRVFVKELDESTNLLLEDISTSKTFIKKFEVEDTTLEDLFMSVVTT